MFSIRLIYSYKPVIAKSFAVFVPVLVTGLCIGLNDVEVDNDDDGNLTGNALFSILEFHFETFQILNTKKSTISQEIMTHTVCYPYGIMLQSKDNETFNSQVKEICRELGIDAMNTF